MMEGTAMKKQVACECGAVYERTEERLTFRDSDHFVCLCCGETLESWSGSRIPVFRLVKEPDSGSEKAPSVAGRGQPGSRTQFGAAPMKASMTIPELRLRHHAAAILTAHGMTPEQISWLIRHNSVELLLGDPTFQQLIAEYGNGAQYRSKTER